MPTYEMLFQHSISTDELLAVGSAFRYGGDVWRVNEATRGGDGDVRLVLGLWPNEVPYPSHIYGVSPASI